MFSINKVEADALDTLIAISKKTFLDAFLHLNKPDDINAYVAKAFSKEQLLAELNNPDSEFYFALVNDEIAGYIKINTGLAQTEFKMEDSIEIERIYVSDDHQNKKIGKRLMDFAIEIAIAKNMRLVWLGVWEHNDKAIRFYERNGFKRFGSHEFVVGTDVQTDLLMRRMLG